MRKAVETTLHKYGLVALAVNNPQLAVRLGCRSKEAIKVMSVTLELRWKHNHKASIETDTCTL